MGDYEQKLINVVAMELLDKYKVMLIKDAGGAVDYKVFHQNHSYPIPTPTNSSIQWRYPYADIYIFRKRNNCRNLITYAINRCIGFQDEVKWPNGTKLVDFADFRMRFSKESDNYLEKLYSKSWFRIGSTHSYDHYHQRPNESGSKKFLIPKILRSPATPFYVPLYLKHCRCEN